MTAGVGINRKMENVLLMWRNQISLVAVLNVWMLFFFLPGVLADTRQPAAIIALPENENAIVVEKKTQTLYLFSASENQLLPRFQFPCSTGEVSGRKEKAGDKKTPEGIYFLIDEYEDRYLSPIYGKKAFPTDYPNLIDKRSGKDGFAIWIHGTNKKLQPMDSNGCVAMENEDILTLSRHITLHATPVIMVEEMQYRSPEILSGQAERLSRYIEQWSAALISGSYHDYLAFYSSEYLPDISWWESWVKIRNVAGKIHGQLALTHRNPAMYHYDDLFVMLFDLYLTAEAQDIYLGKRKMFLRQQGEQFSVIGDEFQQVADQLDSKEFPLVAAGRLLSVPQWQEAQMVALVQQWLAAWSEKDMEAYASFYADAFRADGMNKQQWVARKNMLAKKYDYIQVSGKNFTVEKKGDQCDVVFFQDYESSGLSTQGTKRLTFVNKGGSWKIFQESWKEK